MKDASDLILLDKVTKEPILKADYANTTNVEFKSERVYAKKKGVKAVAWDSAREGTLTMETELFDLKLLSIVAGNKGLDKGANSIFHTERYTLNKDHIIKLDKTPIEGSVSVFKLGKDGLSHEQAIPQLVDGADGSVPKMVTEVSVSAKDTTADITWAAAKGANSYIVYRDGVQVGQPVSTSFTDSNLVPEKEYKYTVSAVNNNGTSPKSAEVVITTATAGTEVAGKAVTATPQAIQDAEKNAQIVSANGLNFSVTAEGGVKLSDAALTGAQYVVYYMAMVDGVSSFSVDANKFADNFEIYANSYIRDQQTGRDHFAQIHYTNAKPEGSFTFGQDATKAANLSIKFDLMPDENDEMAEFKFIED